MGKPARRHPLLKATLLVLIALPLLLALLAWSALHSEAGGRILLRTARQVLPGHLEATIAGGTVADGLALRDVVWRDAAREIRIDRLDGRWHADLTASPPALRISTLDVGRLQLTLLPQPDKPPSLPDSLRLPAQLQASSIRIGELDIRKDKTDISIKDIRLALASDGNSHRIDLAHASTPYGVASAALTLGGQRPFPVDGKLALDAALAEHRYRLDGLLSGDLSALGVQLDANGDGLQGRARITATPFDAVPFKEAHVDLQRLDPRVALPSLPPAALSAKADLRPRQGTAGLEVAGPVSVSNASPGPWDEPALPFASVSGDLTLRADGQSLEAMRIALPGGGALAGTARLSQGRATLEARAENVDPHALHTKLKPESLSGPITASSEGKEQQLAMALQGKALELDARARATPQSITLDQGELRVGKGRLVLTGNMARDGSSEVAAHGALHDFNPAALLSVRGKATQASINATFDAAGKLEPDLSARLRFAVGESSYAGLPMTGQGTLEIDGKTIGPSDARLLVAGNSIALKGAFGRPGDVLSFNLDAPALGRLGYGLSGAARANGTVSGTLERPSVAASASAAGLGWQAWRVANLDVVANTQGVPGRDPAARVRASVEAKNLVGPPGRLDTLHADVNGTYARHEASMAAQGRLRGQALDLRARAQGRLEERSPGYAWSGIVQSLESRGTPRVVLDEPVALQAASGRISLGKTSLTVQRAGIALDHLRYGDDGLSTAGRLSSLAVADLLALQRQFTGETPPVATDLVLDGSWDVTLGSTASGRFELRRRGGDVRLREGPQAVALGLQELALQGVLAGREARVDTRLAASRIGRAEGSARIGLLGGAGQRMVMPGADSAVSASVGIDLPRLQQIASLAGPRIGIDGGLQGRFSVGGTLSSPVLAGDVTGDGLAFTLYDQGIRLSDGVVRIHVADNIAELRQVEFRGGEGTLRAVGRIPLDAAHPTVQANIIADRLQLLANPSGNLTVSGRAAAANTNGQLDITGRFTVDRALFTQPQHAAPSLGDDVVVIRGDRRAATPAQTAGPASDKTQPARAGAFSPHVNVEIDLGEHFRFQGSGADLRLAGLLRVTSAPRETPQASGTVRVFDGTFEAFGTKLAIERGVLNFNGPATNPGLHIVAMRREQEVAAGVDITGTVRQPIVKLISEPQLADEEVLSWLVFGHGTGSGSGSELGAQAAARGAALGLLNSFGGKRLAKGFGLDKLSVGTSDFGSGSQQVIALGKEISDRLYVGYEQSLAGASGLLKLTYELSRNWSVVLRGGAIAGIDLFFNRRFDTRNRQETSGKLASQEGTPP
ncbi:translocation/assembly module TamB domain-containing protein [Noviherbaspirillum galbum]|uniref:Translocation and assembly module TamB C-terminal domain-containing protein n=1 Tax=Noviherbaspirillum galbum TaxID=2709383 RepID=A0A6B3STN8_9BURK|nr:translocation/assembly module TamB domain-containing protein [Noviherbaspirillum galbum]NEX60999.1 hypothetical protein [Noviherbaspirillum galbum]